ncbi:MAG: dihydroorotate dehydrogenase-like protein [Anaerolineales bacterium]|nr:dihydroorotate dehydrogenase-like protein [Anaerolineales bacterium]
MVDLKTTFMGIPLRSPIVVGASSVSAMVDRIAMAEQAGAGALVIRSLFEEQIQLDALRLQDDLSVGAESYSEALSYFPNLKHGDAAEHLMWVEKARKAVKMPLFASLNAVSPGAWSKYAAQLEATGIDGLELNVYAVEANPDKTPQAIELELYETVASVTSQVKVPVAVKLSPYYTSTSHIAHGLAQRGVQALVLFNRFLQPDIDPTSESLTNEMTLSEPAEIKLPLRWVALLHGRIQADLALSTGIHTGTDAAKALLAGATVVQTASALIKHGVPYLSTMLRQLEGWMEEKGYKTPDDFRGKLSQKKAPDPFIFERAQYVKLLLSQK